MASMKKCKQETFYVEEGVDNCSSVCITTTEYFFDYDGKTFKLQEREEVTGGTAGTEVTYRIAVLDESTGDYRSIDWIGAEEGLHIIGYENCLLFFGSAYHYQNKWSENTVVYNVRNNKVIPTK